MANLNPNVVSTLSEYVFSPNGTDLLICKDMKGAAIKSHGSNEVVTTLKALGIKDADYSKEAVVRDVVNDVTERLKQSPQLSVESDIIYDPDFFMVMLEEIYGVYTQNTLDHRANDKSELISKLEAARRELNDLKDNQYTSMGKEMQECLERDTKLFSSITNLLNSFSELASNTIRMNYLLRPRSGVKKQIDDAVAEQNFVNSSFFTSDGDLVELYCKISGYRYCRSSSELYLYRCTGCGASLFSPFAKECCPCCDSKIYLVDRVYDGKFRGLKPKFIEGLSRSVDAIAKGSDVNIDMSMWDPLMKEFYQTFYAKTVEELQMAVAQDYLEPLEAVLSRGYSPEGLAELRSMYSKYQALDSGKQAILAKKGYDRRLKDALDSFNRTYIDSVSEEFIGKIDQVLSSGPSRSALEAIRSEMEGLDGEVLQLLRSKGQDTRIQGAFDDFNRSEAADNVKRIRSILDAFGTDDLGRAREMLEQADGVMSSLHRDVAPLVSKEVASDLDRCRARYEYACTVDSLKDMFSEIDRLLDSEMGPDIVSRCDMLASEIDSVRADESKSQAFSREGYDSKYGTLCMRVLQFKTRKVLESLTALSLRISGNDVAADLEIVNEIDSLVEDQAPDVAQAVRADAAYVNYTAQRKSVMERRDRADAESFNESMSSVEAQSDDRRFSADLKDLVRRYGELNDGVRAILGSEMDYDRRMGAMKSRRRAINVANYAGEFSARLIDMLANIDAVGPETVDEIKAECASMESDSRSAVDARLGIDTASAVDDLVTATGTIRKLGKSISELVNQPFSDSTSDAISDIDADIALIPAKYQDRFKASDANRALTDYKVGFAQWQMIQLVVPIQNSIAAVEDGKQKFDVAGPAIDRMYRQLLPVHKQTLEEWGYTRRYGNLANIVGDRKYLLKELAEECESNITEDTISAFMSAWDSSTEPVREDVTAKALYSRVKRAESEYWLDVARKIKSVVDANSGLFHKFSADDVQDIREVYDLYSRMPEEFRITIEDASKKLDKMYHKVKV